MEGKISKEKFVNVVVWRNGDCMDVFTSVFCHLASVGSISMPCLSMPSVADCSKICRQHGEIPAHLLVTTSECLTNAVPYILCLVLCQCVSLARHSACKNHNCGIFQCLRFYCCADLALSIIKL